MNGCYKGRSPHIVLVATLILLVPSVVTISGQGIGPRADMAPSAEQEMGIWHSEVSWPSDIRPGDANILYLPGELVVFARNTGQSATSGPIDVWTYFESNNTWVKVNATGPCPDRRTSNPAFANDPESGRAFYFGGSIGWNYDPYLYIYHHSNQTWTRPVVAGAPSGRTYASMVYDAPRDLIWIFGGSTGYNQRSNVIYSYGPGPGWSSYSPAVKPSARSVASIELVKGEIYISLGSTGQGYPDDLWSFNMTTGTWAELSDDLGIRTHYGAVLAYDRIAVELVLTMGHNHHSGGGGWGWDEYLNDTYRIDPVTGDLSQVMLDPRITGRDIRGWSRIGGELYIFGGYRNGSLRDVWRLDIHTLSLQETEPSLNIRSGTNYKAFDPDDGGKLLIISDIGNDPEDSIWVVTYYSLADGYFHNIEVDDPPSGFVHHSGMASAYDHEADRLYLYGGYEREYIDPPGPGNEYWVYTFYGSMWSLDLTTGAWEEKANQNSPGALSDASMILDDGPEHNLIYLYGGRIPNGESDMISVYNVTRDSWIRLNPPTKPSGRMQTTLTLDAQRKGFYMFGGRDNGSTEFNDLWFFHTDSQKWEPMSGAQNPPDTRYGHGMAVNPSNGELMVFGTSEGQDPNVYLWRPGWKEWIAVTDNEEPNDWSFHGQAYCPLDGKVYIWSSSEHPTDVWSFVPIMRTIAEQGRLVDSAGTRVYDAYPTVLDYSLRLTGYTDLDISDLGSMEIALRTEGDHINITWSAGGSLAFEGNLTWFTFPNTPTMTIDNGKWTLDIPIEVTMEAPEGAQVTVGYTPGTARAYTETRQTVNSFTLHSLIEVKRHHFSTPLQPIVEPGNWLFGRCDLSVSDFDITFAADPSVRPTSDSFTVTFSNAHGDSDSWRYVPGEKGNLTVPIVGEDGSQETFVMNITDEVGDLVNSQEFMFWIDLDPAPKPVNVSFRADSFTDQRRGIDNDNEVFLAWDPIASWGPEVRSICYSEDISDWPNITNPTTEYKKFQLSEGRHTFFVWAVDQHDRASPFVEVPVLIDMHKPVFADPIPSRTMNVTSITTTVSINVTDALSGVDPDTIEMMQTMANNLPGPWTPVTEGITGGNGTFRISLEVQLHAGIKNLVQFRAADMAQYGVAESYVFSIWCRPDLAVPKVRLNSPANGTVVGKQASLSWTGTYIDPDMLMYTLTVIDPLGGAKVIDAGPSTSASFGPSYPGAYSWSVTARAGALTGNGETRTFIYRPEIFDIEAPTGTKGIQGRDLTLILPVKNDLAVQVNLSISAEALQGMVLVSGAKVNIGPIGTGQVMIVLNVSGAEIGSRTLRFNVSDDFGRWRTIEVPVTVEAAPIEDGPEENGTEKSIVPFIIAAVVVLILAAVLAAFLLMRRKKKDDVLDMKVEPAQEEEGPVDLSYDPTGVVGTGTAPKSHVPMTPGLSVHADALRQGQSNVMELTVPKAGEGPGKEPPSEE